MRALIILLFWVTLLSTVLFGDSREITQSISIIFKDGKLIKKQELKLKSTYEYRYEEDYDYSILKKNMINFLGKDWQEIKIDSKSKNAVKKSFKRLGMDYVDHSIFSKKDNPDKEIRMEIKREKLAGRQTIIVAIASYDWGAESGPWK
jgi:hypothetical protein